MLRVSLDVTYFTYFFYLHYNYHSKKYDLPGKAKSELWVRTESKSGAGELMKTSAYIHFLSVRETMHPDLMCSMKIICPPSYCIVKQPWGNHHHVLCTIYMYSENLFFLQLGLSHFKYLVGRLLYYSLISASKGIFLLLYVYCLRIFISHFLTSHLLD